MGIEGLSWVKNNNYLSLQLFEIFHLWVLNLNSPQSVSILDLRNVFVVQTNDIQWFLFLSQFSLPLTWKSINIVRRISVMVTNLFWACLCSSSNWFCRFRTCWLDSSFKVTCWEQSLSVAIMMIPLLQLLLILITLVFSGELNFIRWFLDGSSSDGHRFQKLSDAFCNHCLKATITDLRI